MHLLAYLFGSCWAEKYATSAGKLLCVLHCIKLTNRQGVWLDRRRQAFRCPQCSQRAQEARLYCFKNERGRIGMSSLRCVHYSAYTLFSWTGLTRLMLLTLQSSVWLTSRVLVWMSDSTSTDGSTRLWRSNWLAHWSRTGESIALFWSSETV